MFYVENRTKDEQILINEAVRFIGVFQHGVFHYFIQVYTDLLTDDPLLET